MVRHTHPYQKGAEALVVGLAKTGDQLAFTELVRRRQAWVRMLMRRCSGDDTLADDLAQMVFVKAWRKLSQLRDPKRFGSWLKRLAVTEWLQHARRNDALQGADSLEDGPHSIATIKANNPGVAQDLNRALATLPVPVRTCVVLSYHDGMSHAEIAAATGLPVGTVKSHISRGSRRLRQLLSDYQENGEDQVSHEH